MGFKDFWLGSSSTSTQPNMTPEQMNLLNTIAGTGGQGVTSLINNLNTAGTSTAPQLQLDASGNPIVDKVNTNFNAGGNSYQLTAEDRAQIDENIARLSGAGLSAIDEKLRRDTENALNTNKRFSTANALLQGRLAGEAALNKSQLLAGVYGQELQAARQGRESLFGRQLTAQQLGSQASMFNAGALNEARQFNITAQLQNKQNQNQAFGALSSLYGSALGAQPYNTVVNQNPGWGSTIMGLGTIGIMGMK